MARRRGCFLRLLLWTLILVVATVVTTLAVVEVVEGVGESSSVAALTIHHTIPASASTATITVIRR